jgi:hypothetical protein
MSTTKTATGKYINASMIVTSKIKAKKNEVVSQKSKLNHGFSDK